MYIIIKEKFSQKNKYLFRENNVSIPKNEPEISIFNYLRIIDYCIKQRRVIISKP